MISYESWITTNEWTNGIERGEGNMYSTHCTFERVLLGETAILYIHYIYNYKKHGLMDIICVISDSTWEYCKKKHKQSSFVLGHVRALIPPQVANQGLTQLLDVKDVCPESLVKEGCGCSKAVKIRNLFCLYYGEIPGFLAFGVENSGVAPDDPSFATFYDHFVVHA